MVARLNNYKNLPKALDESFEIPFDVSFRVISSDGGNTETVGAHKIMLALRSEVLRNLFRGCEAEGFQLDGDTITVRNQDPDIFRMIVEHCYNRIKSSPSRKSFRFLIDLYIMAARLKIKPLQVLAINYILKSLVKY